MHASLDNTTDSLFYYQEAERLYQKYGTKHDKVDIRLNIALLYVVIKRFDIAITMLKDVITNLALFGDDSSIAKATAGLGLAYKHSGEYELAKDYTLKALEYFKNNRQQHDVASELHNLASIYIYLFDYEKSIEYAQKAIELSKKNRASKSLRGCLKNIS